MVLLKGLNVWPMMRLTCFRVSAYVSDWPITRSERLAKLETWLVGFSGRKASRSADPTPDQVRAGHQSQDRESTRPGNSPDAARARRRCDRMKAVSSLWNVWADCAS